MVCRGQSEKSGLLRVVRGEGGLVLDREHSMAGRGAYVHASPACLSRMANLKMWAAAFRISASALEIEQVRKLMLEAVKTS